MNVEPVDKNNWVSLAQAATILSSTPLNVLMHIKRGVLTGVEQEGDWLVAPDSLAVLLLTRREGNAPAVCSNSCSKAHGCKSCG